MLKFHRIIRFGWLMKYRRYQVCCRYHRIKYVCNLKKSCKEQVVIFLILTLIIDVCTPPLLSNHFFILKTRQNLPVCHFHCYKIDKWWQQAHTIAANVFSSMQENSCIKLTHHQLLFGMHEYFAWTWVTS